MNEEKVKQIDQFLKENFVDFKLIFAGGRFSFLVGDWEFQFTLEEDFGLRNYRYAGVQKAKEK